MAMLWDNPLLRPNPGKFDSALDRALYELSLEGGPDEQVGSSTEAPGTWAGIMRSGAELAKALSTGSYGKVAAEDLDYLRQQAGAILYEDTQGFVSTDFFERAKDLEKHWEKVLGELSIDDEGY